MARLIQVAIGAAVVIMTALALGLRCLVLIQLWTWFVVPFLAAPPLPFGIAMGLLLSLDFLRPPADRLSFKAERFGQREGISAADSLLTLLAGWTIQAFLL